MKALSLLRFLFTLGIREFKLFASVCRWAESECTRKTLPPTPENQRGVLGSALTDPL
jgi:BTB/POZ domain-containing protein 1/2